MKLLILGTSDNFSKNIARFFNLKYEVFAPSSEYMDITSKEEVFDEIEAFSPNAVLFFPTIIEEAECEKDADRAFKHNAYAAGLAAVAAARVNASFVLFSSYKVYGNTKDVITEDTPLLPETLYGKTLLEAEKLALINEKSLVLRLGEAFERDNGMLTSFESLIGSDGIVKISDVKKGSFVCSDTVAKMTDKLLDSGAYGVFNIASAGYASWFEFANEVFRHYDAEVHTYADEEGKFKNSKNYPDNFRLSIEKFKKVTGFVPLDWHDEVKHTVNEKMLLLSAEKALEEK